MQLWEQHRVWAEIDLTALRHNYQLARQYAAGAMVMPIIKADAYGHGAVMAARALSNAPWFGVAAPEEALELRAHGIDREILLLGACPPGMVAEMVAQKVTLCLPDRQTTCRYLAALPSHSGDLRGHIKLDTGMARLGLRPEETTDAVADIMSLPRLQVTGLFTHFALADDPSDPFTRAQLARFTAVREALGQAGQPNPICHCANSAAILTCPAAHFDMVRAGIMLYGSNPLGADAVTAECKPVMALRSAIVRLAVLQAGEGVGYGQTWHAERETVLATIPVGYADGLSRRLSGRVSFLLHGKRVRQVGRICMDMCMLDVTDIPQAAVGDVVTLIGQDGNEQIKAEEHAALTDTISYEIFCAIGKRVPRIVQS